MLCADFGFWNSTSYFLLSLIFTPLNIIFDLVSNAYSYLQITSTVAISNLIIVFTS